MNVNINRPLIGQFLQCPLGRGEGGVDSGMGFSSPHKAIIHISVVVLPQQQRALLSQVQYSSRFAVALFFPKDLDLGLDFGLKYVSDNDCIRYLSVEHLKRETGQD